MKKANHSRSQQHDLTFFRTEKGVCGSQLTCFRALLMLDSTFRTYWLTEDTNDVASLLQERSKLSMEKLLALAEIYSRD